MNHANIDNVRNMRNRIKELKGALKEKGVEVNDEGQVVENNNQFTPEQIAKMTDEVVEAKLQKMKRDEALSQFTSEERKSVEPLLDKLMTTGGSVQENLEIVTTKLFPDRKVDPLKQAINTATGSGPRETPKDDNFADSETGTAAAKAMRGHRQR